MEHILHRVELDIVCKELFIYDVFGHEGIEVFALQRAEAEWVLAGDEGVLYRFECTSRAVKFNPEIPDEFQGSGTETPCLCAVHLS